MTDTTNSDDAYCAALVDAPDVPQAPRRVRHGIANEARQFMRDHGGEYPDKASAVAAFRDQHVKGRSVNERGEVHVYGFAILIEIIVALCLYFAERWYERLVPNK